jgi:hypothetical protein
MTIAPNPFRPGNGLIPPYLAGRIKEIEEFENIFLNQLPIQSNLVLSGLRGVGKTVLLNAFKEKAIRKGWIWAGNDMSASAGVDEHTIGIRLITDISNALPEISLTFIGASDLKVNFLVTEKYLTPKVVSAFYDKEPVLEVDKLKHTLELIWDNIKAKAKGVVIAYDEAQTLVDKPTDKQYPLSMLLEAISHLQRKGIPYLLVLVGLPTLYPNLIACRTYSERMFRQISLSNLSNTDSEDVITKPLEELKESIQIEGEDLVKIVQLSKGNPYFIQFLGKEVYDYYTQQKAIGSKKPKVIYERIFSKLDDDFYQARYDRATEKQKSLLNIISKVKGADEKFAVKDVINASKEFGQPLKSTAIILMLISLMEIGLVFKNGRGQYSFALPMFAQFLIRKGN